MNRISARIDTLIAQRSGVNQASIALIKAHEFDALKITDACYERISAQIDALLLMMEAFGPKMHEVTDDEVDAWLTTV
jgi:hypothetical protein